MQDLAGYEFFILEGLILVGLIWYWLKVRRDNAAWRARKEAERKAAEDQASSQDPRDGL